MLAREAPAVAIQMLGQALEELVAVGNPAAVGRVHANLARLLRGTGEHEAGDSHHAHADALFRRAGDRRAVAQTQLNQAHHLLDLGDRAAARPAAEEALQLARRVGASQTAALATLTLAHVHLDEHAPASALDLSLDALRRLRESGNLWTLAEALWCVGHASLALGRPEAAEAAFAEGLDAARRAGGNPANWAAGLVVARLAVHDRAGAEAVAVEVTGVPAAAVDAALHGRNPEARGDSYQRILAHAVRRWHARDQGAS
ncbi:MAG: hypothetical protein R3F59_15165 [Myxococcota bacterium]